MHRLENLFYHHKGGYYRFWNEAFHSENLEPFVIYEALYKNDIGKVWIRPKKMFFEQISSAEQISSTESSSEIVFRFKEVKNSIVTDRLILTPLIKSDLESYFNLFNDYEVVRYLSDLVPWSYSRQNLEDYFYSVLEPNQGVSRWTWAIRTQEKPSVFMGTIAIWKGDEPAENRGFWLGRQYWNKGYMLEAVKAVNDVAFVQLGFERMMFANAVGNLKSRKIKEKTGARFIGVFPGSFVDKSLKEKELWELTRESWLKFKTQP